MVYHMGRTMVDSADRSLMSYSSVFNSSVPQRPMEAAAARSYGGRPLGPCSYNPPNPPWLNDVDRETSSFASKTNKTAFKPPITAELDFLNKPELYEAVTCVAPGSRGLKWRTSGKPTHIVDFFDAPLDRFYDTDHVFGKESLGHSMQTCPRKYASSFASTDPRFKPAKEAGSGLGPGSYEKAPTITIKDPKRGSYCFKSQTNISSFKTRVANEPPDGAIGSSAQAVQAKHWTSKGMAFSTRERFPRQRPKWKD